MNRKTRVRSLLPKYLAIASGAALVGPVLSGIVHDGFHAEWIQELSFLLWPTSALALGTPEVDHLSYGLLIITNLFLFSTIASLIVSVHCLGIHASFSSAIWLLLPFVLEYWSSGGSIHYINWFSLALAVAFYLSLAIITRYCFRINQSGEAG